jgi:hypothetical protein
MNMTDVETCYKGRFASGFEPEITFKIAKRRLRVYKVGISSWGRTSEGGM